jgi:hypothetical protein
MNRIKIFLLSVILLTIFSCLNPINFDPSTLPAFNISATINPSTEAILVIINDTDEEITAQAETYEIKVLPNSSFTFQENNKPIKFPAGNILFSINDMHYSAAIFGVSYITFGKKDSISIVNNNPINNEVVINNNISDLQDLIRILSVKTGSIYVENRCIWGSILVYVRDYNNQVIISEEIPKESFRYIVIPNLDVNIKNYEVIAMYFTDGVYKITPAVNVGVRSDSSSALPADYKEQRIEFISFIEEDFENEDNEPSVTYIDEIKMVMFSFVNGIHYWVASSLKENVWKDIKVGDIIAPSGIFLSAELSLEERQQIANEAIYTCGSSVTQMYDGFYKWRINSIDENTWIKVEAGEQECLITIQ